MTILCFSNELAKEATSVVGSTGNISNTAFEKKMNEQMSKGSVVFDSAITSSSAADTTTSANTITTTTITVNEAPVQKSPPTRINTAWVLTVMGKFLTSNFVFNKCVCALIAANLTIDLQRFHRPEPPSQQFQWRNRPMSMNQHYDEQLSKMLAPANQCHTQKLNSKSTMNSKLRWDLCVYFLWYSAIVLRLFK